MFGPLLAESHGQKEANDDAIRSEIARLLNHAPAAVRMITSRAIWHVLHGEQQKPMRQSLVASPWMLYTVRTAAKRVRRGTRQFGRTSFLTKTCHALLVRIMQSAMPGKNIWKQHGPRLRAKSVRQSVYLGRTAPVTRKACQEPAQVTVDGAFSMAEPNEHGRHSAVYRPGRGRPVRQTARRRDARNQTHTAPRRRGPRRSRTGRW